MFILYNPQKEKLHCTLTYISFYLFVPSILTPVQFVLFLKRSGKKKADYKRV
jgi:hypothetical protein